MVVTGRATAVSLYSRVFSNLYRFPCHLLAVFVPTGCLLNMFVNGNVKPGQQLGRVRRLAPRPRPVGLLLLPQQVCFDVVGSGVTAQG
jgi:hypothetical protein